MNKRSLKVLIGIISFAIIGLVFSVLVLGVFFSLGQPSGSNDLSKGTNRFKMVTHNPKTGKNTRGIAKLPYDFEDEEYISYEDGTGNHVLITHLGAKEYRCTANCLCEKESNRREPLTGFLLFTGLITVYHSKSWLMAKLDCLKISKKKCEDFEEEFRMKCPMGRIIADPTEIIELTDTDPKDGEKDCKMSCAGKCAPMPGLPAKSKEEAENRCPHEEMEITQLKEGTTGKCQRHLFEEQFREEQLESFCEQIKGEDGEQLCAAGEVGDENAVCDPLTPHEDEQAE